MPTLRLTQSARAADGSFPITVTWEDKGARQEVHAVTSTELAAQDRKDLQWYLEDYLDHYSGTPIEIPERIERRMTELGEQLFADLFQASERAKRLWAQIFNDLPKTRVEISAEIADATELPWELIQDPELQQPLALAVPSFVRVQTTTATTPRLVKRAPRKTPIRLMLVICRPGGRWDVPFRSVARRLVERAGADAADRLELEVLRPPSFAQLGKRLNQAKADGKPFHIVHFDGHGGYGRPSAFAADSAGQNFDQNRFKTHGDQPRGFLFFEDPESARAGKPNQRPVDGTELGQVLRQAEVPVLVLNACQSAYAETPRPDDGGGGGASDSGPAAAPDPNDPKDQIRTYGSLAQAVLDTGVGGVIAMRYSVWVVTAAQFIGEFYESLFQGQSLGEAATTARRHLSAEPGRTVFGAPVPLQDWPVPVVYEAGEIKLFPKPAKDGAKLFARAPAKDITTDGALPRPPEIGFIGRDETLLALDRAFDDHNLVLLHAYAGAGKTATAAEFARWYQRTKGIDGPLLWDCFESYRSLKELIDKLGGLFDRDLQAQGSHWLALTDDQRRALALQILQQVPVLWVWDNVEPVAGFPAGRESQWTGEEQQALRTFLQDLQQTKAKVLLTSRRDEQGWLGHLPCRVQPPPMPMRERREMAEALAARHGQSPAMVKALRALLNYTEGNPMTLTVVVGQALRDRLDTEPAVQAYVEKLRQGQAVFTDDASEGRSTSLGASLDYGFAQAFTDEERRRLSLLHLFQGVVNANTLVAMGHPTNPGRQPLYADRSPEDWIALLDRAAEIGLLTTLGGGYYRIHPALPWFFRAVFAETFPEPPPTKAHRAYAAAVGLLGELFKREFADKGRREALAALRAEEANLRHARALAVHHDWFEDAVKCMQGLWKVFETEGRWAGWARLVAELVPLIEDPATGAPLPDREEDWCVVIHYRVSLAAQQRDTGGAIALLRKSVEVERALAADALAVDPAALTDKQKHSLQALGVALQQLGISLVDANDATCVPALEECWTVLEAAGVNLAWTAFNLGHAYKNVTNIRDLDQAESWYQRSLDLRAAHDRAGQALCFGQLGFVAYKRFKDACNQTDPDPAVLVRHLEAARAAYQRALDHLPVDAHADRAVINNQLGMILQNAGHTDWAAHHYRQSIRYEELQGNRFSAARTKFNLALLYRGVQRWDDALAYARAALTDYQSYGPHAAADVAETEQLIALIEQAAAG